MYSVGVRTLCDFAARSGDLDLRFTPITTAQEGQEGHAAVYARRAEHYQREYALACHWDALHIKGRADGYDSQQHCLEEIKTYRGRLQSIPANQQALHWAQLKLYGAMLCEQQECAGVELALVYYHVDTQKETRQSIYLERAPLWEFLVQLAQAFLAWAHQEAEHTKLIHQTSQTLPFPFSQFRAGQRELAVHGFRSVRDALPLLAQAPTGIGKTLAVLFPALKAMQAADLHKVFYLTAKNSGRQTAIDSMGIINQQAPHAWRVLELVARDKSCVHPDKACHGESCPLARGFYDRLPQARQALLKEAAWTDQVIRQSADQLQVCPYYLQQEMLRWADVIVGDYNHYFDAAAVLHGQTMQQEWRSAVVVDEAHNLLDRARSMYSATLSESALLAARKVAPASLKRSLGQLRRALQEAAPESSADPVYENQIDTELSQIAANTAARLAAYVAEQPLANTHPLLSFYFELTFFSFLAQQFAAHSLLEFRQVQGLWDISIRNVIPAPFLQERYADAHGCILFSATLNPRQFYQDMLGLPAHCQHADIAAPFSARQVQVKLAPFSTRYADRQASLASICQTVVQQYQDLPGNYLLFASSFQYLQQIEESLRILMPALPMWVQRAGMDAQARRDFLAQFQEGGAGLGLAVLGGAFAEGVDLPGKRLIGAFIATLGLPQYNAWNEAVKTCMASSFGTSQAYDYTYLYPGLRKVVQAAGRVIRSEQDQGVIYLLDERYTQFKVKRLLPTWWPAAQALP